MTGPEEFAEDNGATYREDVGWGHLEGPFLVHCYGPDRCHSDAPHGEFKRWVIQSEWQATE